MATTTDIASPGITLSGNATQTPEQTPSLTERMNHTLLNIIRENFNTKYATQAPILSAFRDAVAAHGGTGVDATLLADFQSNVPLSNYDCYKPFADKFNAQPCKKKEVENLFAPGLPDFLAVSGSTTGLTSKIFPRYANTAPRPRFLDPNFKSTVAALQQYRYTDVKEIEHAPGEMVQKIPVCSASVGVARMRLGWKLDDDETWMSLSTPSYAVPWAATVISHYPSFLTIYGLFFLTRRDIDLFFVVFAMAFVDCMREINERWDMLVCCIRNGVLPDLDGIDHVREHLQAHFHADPERAAELLEIGPPFSREGWASHVWPQLRVLKTICSGPFSLVLPRIRSILGPNISIRSLMYGSTESSMLGIPHNDNILDEFVLQCAEFVEFLDVSRAETHENICQAWEVEVGKQYEPILTTRNGLWRYRLGDILTIIGFDPKSQAPIFKWAGRRSWGIQLPHAQITDVHLVTAIKDTSSDDAIKVQEFTTMLDDRTSPPTVGYFVELEKPLGLNAHLARERLFNAFVTTNDEHQRAFENGQIRLPTIRIVRAGTFAAFRHWKMSVIKSLSVQIKIPIIMVDPAAREWLLERVAQEL